MSFVNDLMSFVSDFNSPKKLDVHTHKLYYAQTKEEVSSLIRRGADLENTQIRFEEGKKDDPKDKPLSFGYTPKDEKAPFELGEAGLSLGPKLTPLHLAKTEEVAVALISSKADVNAEGHSKRTPIYRFRVPGDSKVMQWDQFESAKIITSLIQHNADPNREDYNDEYTPDSLHLKLSPLAYIASNKPTLPEVKALIEGGAKVTWRARNKEGKGTGISVLHCMSCEKEKFSKECFKYILDKMIQTSSENPELPPIKKLDDIKDYAGKTCVHYLRNPENLLQLIELGLDVNSRDAKGRTPLHTLAEQYSPYSRDDLFLKLFNALILNGATTTAKDFEGNLPVYFIKGPGHGSLELESRVVKLLTNGISREEYQKFLHIASETSDGLSTDRTGNCKVRTRF